MVDPEDFVRQSAYSTPGRHAARLADLPDDLATLCSASRNVIAHYRADVPELPEERWSEIDSRWLEVVLALDEQRHRGGLEVPRVVADRVAGCCRDHSLFLVGALRQRGVPARSRVGFAHYLAGGWAVDHVVAERWQQDRWRRVDPELGPGPTLDTHDILAGPGAPFETAAEAWLAWRAGDRDLSRYGVQGDVQLCGPGFVRSYVVYEVAHRYGDEMLLWDEWGVTHDSSESAVVDEVAELLVRADAGDDGAESELVARYREDDRLHPGEQVTTHSPYGRPPRVVGLTTRPAAAARSREQGQVVDPIGDR